MPRLIEPCPFCGNDIGDGLIEKAPECPHGWADPEPGDLDELRKEAGE